MTRYLLVVNFEGGVVETPMETWKPEEITAHLDYYKALHQELVSSGELVASEVLAGPNLAKVVTSDGVSAPVVTDGRFQEFKEWVTGYQIVDVESEGAGDRDRREALGRAGARRRRDPAADPGAAGDGPGAVRCRRDGDIPPTGRGRALNVSSNVEELLRELAPQVLGTLARRTGDFDGAEDAVQEALLAAALQWPRDGVPEKPRGWLLQTAARRMIDERRSEQSRRNRESRALLQEVSGREVSAQDDTLTVLFMCCHPALTPASAIALTLRAVGGLTTAEIANAFLVGGATMAQRISRAKQRIKASGEPFRMPTREEQADRVRTVLRVLYLIFNEGYTSSTGRELQRVELSQEAIRLTRMVHRMLPDDGQVAGLLALMLLVDARRPARTNAAGELIPLAEQDRTLWDQALIAEGVVLIDAPRARGRSASTGSRPPSQPFTTRLGEPRTPTGHRSSRCTGCWR
jgi:DNA-directed RNA polymerase specialized sigma24 family protein